MNVLLFGNRIFANDQAKMNSLVGFNCGSAGNKSPCNAGDLGLIPGLGRSPREGNGYPLQYSSLENSMDYSVELQRVGHN